MPGDEIVLVGSSGLHANGASLARLLAGRLRDGYATELDGGRTLGEALLDPSVMYVGLIAALLESDVELHYLSHVTGHGLLKLMRPSRALCYRVERLPPVPPVLEFLVEEARLDAGEAYSTFNMGCGYALYCAAGDGGEVVRVAERLGLERPARRAGGRGAEERDPRADRGPLRGLPARALAPTMILR